MKVILDDPRYREQARSIADEIQALPPVDVAVDALSELVASHSIQA